MWLALIWLEQKGVRELWGLDISAAQIKRSERLFKEKGKKAKLFVSPMELDPGLPHSHFDLVFSIYGLGWSMDLDKTIIHIAEYLKPGGRLVFAWDNPLMQCIDAQNGQYVLSRSYVDERDIFIANNDESFRLHNWKLSTYLNCLANHGFLIEQMVEESEYVHFTLLPLVICTPLLIGFSVLIPYLCFRNLEKQSVVERLRAVD